MELDLAAASALVDRVRRSVVEHARAALSALVATHRPRELVVPASPWPRLPESLAEVLASRPLTLAADGMLYREALADAAAELGLEVRRLARQADPTTLAAEALGVDVAEVTSLLASFGREAGPPWRKDHKLAAAAALCALAPRMRR